MTTRKQHPVRFRKCVEKMQGYTPGEQPKDNADVIKLNTNENPYPPSPRVAEAIQKELTTNGEKLRLYSDPNACALREAAAETYGFQSTNILAGNGSDELLTLLVRSFVEPGEQIAYAFPTYSLYETIAAACGVDTVIFDYDNNYSLPKALFETSAKLIFVANPNSPSGTAYAPEQLQSLAQQVQGVLVIDEAYADFSSSNALSLAKTEPNVVVLRTFSKSYSLAGMRIGLLFANERLVEGVAKVKDSYNLDRLAIAAGHAALRDSQWLQTNVTRVQQTRQLLVDGLTRLGLEVLPSQANFVFARLGSPQRALAAYQYLKAQGVLVRHFAHPRLADGLRITVGTDDQINKFLGCLEDYLHL